MLARPSRNRRQDEEDHPVGTKGEGSKEQDTEYIGDVEFTSGNSSRVTPD